MDLTCPYCRARVPLPQDISVQQVKCPACGREVALDELPTMAPVAAVKPASIKPPSDLRLAGYRFVKLIARGGMGEVHEAIQESLNRRVAVKVLPPELAADANFVRRFEREAGALAQLSHPNIVGIYDRGHDNGFYYFILEYVESRDGDAAATLHRRLRSGPPLKASDVKRLIEQIAGALAYAHSRGIIHRDIKPSNVLLDARDNARLVDFGIAQLLHGHRGEDLRLTIAGEVLGTAGYLAPEQREGRADIDGRADVYACGVMCYEMLTGQLPEGAFEMPSEILPGLDSRWDSLVEKAIQRNRDRRFQRMEEFLVSLRAIEGDQTTVERARVETKPRPSTTFQATPILGKCSRCQTLNPGDNRFCTECGANLYEPCLACNAENRVGTKYCGKCGTDTAKLKRTAKHRDESAALLERANQITGSDALPTLDEAHEALSKLLKEEPSDADAQRSLATVRERMRPLFLEKAQGQRGTDAMATYRKMLEFLLEDNEAHSRLNVLEQELQRLIQAGSELVGSGEFQSALEHIDKSLEEFDEEPRLLKLREETQARWRATQARWRAQFLERAQGQRGLEAMATYREMLTLFPDDNSARSRLSALEQELQALLDGCSLLIKRKEFEAALKRIDDVLKQYNQEPHLLNLRALAQTGLVRQMDELVRQWLDKREYATLLRRLDELAAYLNEPAPWRKARQQAEKAIQTAAGYTDCGDQSLAANPSNVIKSFVTAGDTDCGDQSLSAKKAHEALAEYEKALQTCADYSRASEGVRKAKRALERAASRRHTMMAAVQLGAFILVCWGISFTKERWERSDQNAWEKTEQAVLTLGNDDDFLKGKLYKEYLGKHPNGVGASDATQALARLTNYDWAKAIADYDKILEIMPRDADAWHSKGYALYKLGRYDEASECYAKARLLRQGAKD